MDCHLVPWPGALTSFLPSPFALALPNPPTREERELQRPATVSHHHLWNFFLGRILTYFTYLP
ncbi:hypothetical protein CSPX01_01529 [Colletotrichum filicis]|nr:hypothetical protein CSPX01_01529 [Colletotrichum filicis]